MSNKGRPPYKKKYCKMLLTHMGSGYSFESFAGVLTKYLFENGEWTEGISKAVLYCWQREEQDFEFAREVGIELSRLFWEKLGIDNIINITGTDSKGNYVCKSLNANVWNANMRNRFDWSGNQKEISIRAKDSKLVISTKKS